MADMTTTLYDYSDNGNSRNFRLSGHTVQKPQLVLQRRKAPTGEQTIAEDEVTVYYGTENSDGDLLSGRIMLSVKLRRPIDGIAADLDAAVVVLRDFVASDQLEGCLDSQSWLPTS